MIAGTPVPVPKSASPHRLQSLCQVRSADFTALDTYLKQTFSIQDHQLTGIGKGPTKREAEKAAASDCLQQLQELGLLDINNKAATSLSTVPAPKKQKTTCVSIDTGVLYTLSQCVCKTCKGGMSPNRLTLLTDFHPDIFSLYTD